MKLQIDNFIFESADNRVTIKDVADTFSVQYTILSPYYGILDYCIKEYSALKDLKNDYDAELYKRALTNLAYALFMSQAMYSIADHRLEMIFSIYTDHINEIAQVIRESAAGQEIQEGIDDMHEALSDISDEVTKEIDNGEKNG